MTLLCVVVVWGVLLWWMLKVWAWTMSDRVVKWNSLTSAILYGFGTLLEDPPHRPPSNLSAQVSNSCIKSSYPSLQSPAKRKFEIMEAAKIKHYA